MLILTAEGAEESGNRILHLIFENTARAAADVTDSQPLADSQQVVHMNADTPTTTTSSTTPYILPEPQPQFAVSATLEPHLGPSMAPYESEAQPDTL